MEFSYDSALDDKDEKRIRLLRLLPPKDPASFSVTPEFVLTTYLISEAPEYQALSYTWGPPEDGMTEYKKSEKKPIVINGYPLPVFPNLMDALRHIRQAWNFTDPVQHIWIDAICINQENMDERGQQVQFMSEIYQTASQVLVWLGRSNMESRIAFKFIRNRKVLSLFEYQQYVENNGELYAIAFHALCQLLNRRWFTRVWTLQEFAFASKYGGPLMICGRDRLQWNLFYGLGSMDSQFRSHYLKEKHSGPQAGYFRKAQEYWSIVSIMHKIRQNIPWGYHLPYLLQATRYFAAKDPRDRVYALLGLAGRKYQQELKVVYEDEGDDPNKV
jgi:Heterokaryon incompatibility protein (HET)